MYNGGPYESKLSTCLHCTQKPDDFRHPAFLLAESEGFEPPDPLRSTVFKTAAFDHSANSPICFCDQDLLLLVAFSLKRDCKGTNKIETCKLFFIFLIQLRGCRPILTKHPPKISYYFAEIYLVPFSTTILVFVPLNTFTASRSSAVGFLKFLYVAG